MFKSWGMCRSMGRCYALCVESESKYHHDDKLIVWWKHIAWSPPSSSSRPYLRGVYRLGWAVYKTWDISQAWEGVVCLCVKALKL